MKNEERQKIIDTLEEASLLVNNAWSDACMITTFLQRLPIIELQDQFIEAIDKFKELTQ